MNFPAHGKWLEMILLTDLLSGLPPSKFPKFNNPIWRARGWQWIDPKKELIVVLLTNRIHPKRGNKIEMYNVRRNFHNALLPFGFFLPNEVLMLDLLVVLEKV